ncbi:sperm flagellar protein 1-like [Drosophila obscura]|uniref:sperm flagellar protein 1-like n=1 Tax=Drosophila obscura TaxID=7282 RepID=UPI000BA13CEC|nr:sperm flagellar protein 1-like [Drosophila obscura]
MSHIRPLQPDECSNLNLWLKMHQIDINAKKRRELSDVLPVATIVKMVYTRLVDLNPYAQPRNSVANKLQNWKVFNFTVLKKLNLKLSESDMRELAEGKVGAIEWLFHELFVRPENLHGEDDQVIRTAI